MLKPTLINPTFVTHLRKELVPLAKLSPDDPTTVEVFACFMGSTRAPRVPARALAGRHEALEHSTASDSLAHPWVPRGRGTPHATACALPKPSRTIRFSNTPR